MIEYEKAIERLRSWYPPFTFGSWGQCAYCGIESTAHDHAIPWAFISSIDRKRVPWASYSFGPQALACTRCNSVLGTKYFDTFEERAKYASGRLLKKALAISAEWGDEINQLGYGLKKFVELKQAQKADMIRRSEWHRTENYYLNLEGLLYEPTLQHNNSAFKPDYFTFFGDTLAGIYHCLATRENGKRKTQDSQRRATGIASS